MPQLNAIFSKMSAEDMQSSPELTPRLVKYGRYREKKEGLPDAEEWDGVPKQAAILEPLSCSVQMN